MSQCNIETKILRPTLGTKSIIKLKCVKETEVSTILRKAKMEMGGLFNETTGHRVGVAIRHVGSTRTGGGFEERWTVKSNS